MKKTLGGIVVSKKMQDTAIVEVTRYTPHRLYKKLIKVTKKYLVATDNKEIEIGDMVVIEETKPISKNKNFRIMEVKK